MHPGSRCGCIVALATVHRLLRRNFIFPTKETTHGKFPSFFYRDPAASSHFRPTLATA
ncbi:hypothetical protein C1H46_031900 [Malus baccata]|uniref:Uncharacterized protein n=1 Tax=Malus baccata TaxID=106549 RepID=A0A540L891_MALBA|nr:hypothetical protein C1H46_031900 [Malus baccata]